MTDNKSWQPTVVKEMQVIWFWPKNGVKKLVEGQKILSFSVTEDYKGKLIGKKIEACLFEWGIERVCAIIVDNASGNDVAIDYVKNQMLMWKNVDALVLRGDYMHVRCCAHILILIVLGGLKELHASIVGIRNAVKYVRSSTSRLKAFKQCVDHVKGPYGTMVLDCITRWNSTYLMLMTALKFREAFERMAEVDKPYEAYFRGEENEKKRVGPPKLEDWEHATRIVRFLKIFYDATLTFSASLSVTSNLCYDSLSALEKSKDVYVHLMASSMREKYDKYWECTEKINKILIIASILDPRCKMDFTKHIFSMIFFDNSAKIEEMVAVMKGLLNSLSDAYSGWNSSPPLPSESFPSGSASSSPHLVDDTDRQQGYLMEHGDDTL
ncbi:BED-type domain-containing protein [Citrus sinensis]|uniref:BED-type domain-containing protein n=1 Tax=Citrus sinensis TaxID=2711 RepID=A0ACB8M552_CITSI|nr:BED-type domain-containing protein [Citrus sinensis]